MQQGRVANIPTVASLLAAFFTIALTAGVIGAGVAMPTVAAFGTVTKSTIGMYDDLPTEFTSVVPNQQTTVYANDGKTVIATLWHENRIVVPLKQIAPVMRKAQVAIEDKRFYQHGGVDLEGMGAVAAGTLAGKQARGASTLTQQYVKVTLQTAAHRRGDSKAEKAASAVTAARKLQEMKYATAVEKVKSKDEILQDYLNLVYFGDQAYGVEAAARHFFSTTAAKLTLPQAATLAGQVQNPGTVNAVANPRAALKRRNVVLQTMLKEHMITEREYEAAVAAPLGLKLKAQPNMCVASQFPFFCHYVLGWLEQQPAFGDSVRKRQGNLLDNGYKIVTTIDARLQREAQDALRSRVFPSDYRANDKRSVGGAAVTIEPGTGKVRTMVLSTDFSNHAGQSGKQGVNWAVDQAYGASGGFAIGSTMKMFAVATAAAQGWDANRVIGGIRPAKAFYSHGDFPGRCTVGPEGWPVNNSEGDINPTSVGLGEATAQSVNTAFARLAQILGPCNIRSTAMKMGMHHMSGDPDKFERAVPGLVLGSIEVSPMTLARSYGVLAAKGKLCPDVPVEYIEDSNGKRVPLKIAGCAQALPPQAATTTANILKSVLISGTGKGLLLADHRPAAGKTGTDDGNESWFAGITPQLSTAVWVGTPLVNPQPGMPAPFKHVTVGGKYFKQVYGADIAGPVWKDIMNAASEGLPKLDFGQNAPAPPPPADKHTVPDVSGKSPDQAMAALKAAGFAPYISRRVATNRVEPGLVAYTKPAAGQPAQPGDRIGLRIARRYTGDPGAGPRTPGDVPGGPGGPGNDGGQGNRP